jgi:hypothetical protein
MIKNFMAIHDVHDDEKKLKIGKEISDLLLISIGFQIYQHDYRFVYFLKDSYLSEWENDTKFPKRKLDQKIIRGDFIIMDGKPEGN